MGKTVLVRAGLEGDILRIGQETGPDGALHVAIQFQLDGEPQESLRLIRAAIIAPDSPDRELIEAVADALYENGGKGVAAMVRAALKALAEFEGKDADETT